jgi:hypothetical protein
MNLAWVQRGYQPPMLDEQRGRTLARLGLHKPVYPDREKRYRLFLCALDQSAGIAGRKAGVCLQRHDVLEPAQREHERDVSLATTIVFCSAPDFLGVDIREGV